MSAQPRGPRTKDLEVGIAVDCTVCGLPNEMAAGMCNWQCPGYDQPPEPGKLWPGETREEFGY